MARSSDESVCLLKKCADKPVASSSPEEVTALITGAKESA